MRINYLYEVEDWNWTAEYHKAVLLALNECEVCEIPVAGKTEEEIVSAVWEAPACDVWYCMSFLDKWLIPVSLRARVRNERIVVHNHGGMETGDTIALERGPYDTTELPKIATCPRNRVLFNTVSNLKDFSEFYRIPETCFDVVGFPVPDLSGCAVEPFHGILVPGRFSESKQIMLAAEILSPYKDIVLFSTGVMPSKRYILALDALGFSVDFARGKKYRELLGSYTVAFTASLADSFCLSIAECVSAGMNVVTPNCAPFTEYSHPGLSYEPYSISDARRKIDLALRDSGGVFQSQVSYFSPERVTQRIKCVLKELENE